MSQMAQCQNFSNIPRTSSKACPLYTPRRAKQKPHPNPFSSNTSQPNTAPRTIKCKLNTILRDKSILPALKDASERYNLITFEGAKVLQMYVLDALNSGTPLPAMNQTFIRRIFESVTRHRDSTMPKSTSDPTINLIRDEYARTRPPGAQWTSGWYVYSSFFIVIVVVCLSIHSQPVNPNPVKPKD